MTSQNSRNNAPAKKVSYLFMLGRSAASKIICVRPVGGLENTSNIRENPNMKNYKIKGLLLPCKPIPPKFRGWRFTP